MGLFPIFGEFFLGGFEAEVGTVGYARAPYSEARVTGNILFRRQRLPSRSFALLIFQHTYRTHCNVSPCFPRRCFLTKDNPQSFFRRATLRSASAPGYA